MLAALGELILGMLATLLEIILLRISLTEAYHTACDFFDDLLHLSFPDPWAWREHRRQRRIKAGLCATCAYDLRAHKPGERCPECGQPIPAAGSPL